MTKLIRYSPDAGAGAGVAIASPRVRRESTTPLSASRYPPGHHRVGLRVSGRAHGYRDGFDSGRDDARSSDRFDPVRARRYATAITTTTAATDRATEYSRVPSSAFERGTATATAR